MTDKVQKIREEVERLHNLLPVMDGDNISVNYADRICTTLEMYIDSLQEEPVSEDLEEACKQLAENARKRKAETSSPFFSQTDYKQGVIDGAEWGRNQAMAEIQAQSMALAHGCTEENTSEDLKKAADNALESISDQYDIISVGSCLEMFRLGAKWQLNRLQKQKDGK